MKLHPTLLLPGLWIALSLVVIIFCEIFGPSFPRTMRIDILASYAVAAPAALLCGGLGAALILRRGLHGAASKTMLAIHVALLALAGLMCVIIVTFPVIGPH